jgi:replicative DNA helicase
VVERIDELYHRDSTSDVTGVPTGFIDLDRMTSGMQAGSDHRGRAPSMGKTAFSLNIGEHVAVEQAACRGLLDGNGGRPAGHAYAGLGGRLDQHRLRTGRLLDEDWPRLTHSIQRMNDAQLFIDETPALNPMELRAVPPSGAAMRAAWPDHHRLPPADVGFGQRREPRHRDLGNLAFAEGLAKELNCPVIACRS